MKKFAIIIAAILYFSTVSTYAYTPNPLYEKGYRGYVDFSVGVISSDNIINTDLTTSHGYSTGFGLYTGLGTGLSFSPAYAGSILSMPLFLDLKYSILNREFSPYIAMKTGINYSLENYTGGVYVSPSIGFDIKKHLSLLMRYIYETTSYDGYKFKKNAFSIGIAIGF